MDDRCRLTKNLSIPKTKEVITSLPKTHITGNSYTKLIHGRGKGYWI